MIMGTRVRHRMGIFGILGTGLLTLAALPGCTAGQAGEEPLVVTEALSATMDTGLADDPFRPISELPGVSAAPRIAVNQGPLEPADVSRSSAVGEPLDNSLADPSLEPPVALPTNPLAPVRPLGDDVDFPDGARDNTSATWGRNLKTLTLTVKADGDGDIASIAAGPDTILEGPLGQGELFAGWLRELFAAENPPFERVLLKVDKCLDFKEMERISHICMAGKHVLAVSVVHEGNADTTTTGKNASSNDDRLKRLEDRFDALLKELRDAKNPANRKSAPPALDVQGVPQSTAQKGTKPPTPSKVAKPNADAGGINIFRKPHRDGDVETIALTRATYKFPEAKARALKAFTEFLATNLSDEVEVRFKDSALQVTASAEDQAVIAQFISLLQARGSAAPKPNSSRIEDDGAAPEEPARTKSGQRVGF